MENMTINRFANNPRQISKKEHARLEKDLADLGDLGGVVHDIDTNSLIGGNQRSEIMGVISGGNVPIITERFDPPTKQGTVALGYIEWRGEKYAYRAVKGWTDEQRRRANIEANRAGGSWSTDILANEWDAKELISFGFDEDWLREQGKMYGAVSNLLGSELTNDPNEEWKDMPEFEQEDLSPFFQIKISFSCQADVDAFSALLDQKISEKTRSIWYPKATKIDITSELYKNES